MTTALKATILAVHEDRQELIDYLRNSGVESAEALADALEQSDYTTVLAEIATHLEDEDYMAELGARMLAIRGKLQGGQFFGDTHIIPALAQADDEIEAEFNAEISGDTTGAVSEDGDGNCQRRPRHHGRGLGRGRLPGRLRGGAAEGVRHVLVRRGDWGMEFHHRQRGGPVPQGGRAGRADPDGQVARRHGN